MYFELPFDLSEDLALLREYCQGRFHPEPNRDRVHIHRIDLSFFDSMKTLSEILKGKGLKLASAFHFITLPRQVSHIHADGVSAERTRHCGLNFPIANCEFTYMNWFGNHPVDSEPKDVVSRVPARYPIDLAMANATWTPSHQLELKRPAVVRTDVWHNIDNSRQENQRKIVSVRFEGNPTLNELAARFQ